MACWFFNWPRGQYPFSTRDSKGASTIKPKPPPPQHESSKHNIGRRRHRVRSGATVLIKQTQAWLQIKSGYQATKATHQMNRSTAGHVYSVQLVQPSLGLPHPVCRERVRNGVGKWEQNVCFQLYALRHCTGHYSCCGRGEGKMEKILGKYLTHVVVIRVGQKFTKTVESSGPLTAAKTQTCKHILTETPWKIILNFSCLIAWW